MEAKFTREMVSSKTLDGHLECDVKSFGSFDNLTHFAIDTNDSETTVKTDTPFPNLEEEYNQNNGTLSADLKEGFRSNLDNNRLIVNYDKYRVEKWINFLKVLQTNEIVAKEKPDIVAFGGNISDMFSMGDWDVFAIKFKGVIYLFKGKTLEFDPEQEGNANEKGYFGLRFAYMVTDRDVMDINQFEKFFNVDKIEFKDNKLIVLNEIDAIDRNGAPIDAKCREKWNLKNPKTRKAYSEIKLLNDWSQCLVKNVKTLIVGYRDDNILKSTEVVIPDLIPGKCRQFWTEAKRFSVFEQSLDFIKTCVESEQELYGFEFKKFSKTISSYEYKSSDEKPLFFLPEFYRK